MRNTRLRRVLKLLQKVITMRKRNAKTAISYNHYSSSKAFALEESAATWSAILVGVRGSLSMSNLIPKFAEVHEKAQAMRKRMTQQSTELAIEKNRRAIAGIAQADRETNYLIDENGEYFQ
jgi:hypothetical protein